MHQTEPLKSGNTQRGCFPSSATAACPLLSVPIKTMRRLVFGKKTTERTAETAAFSQLLINQEPITYLSLRAPTALIETSKTSGPSDRRGGRPLTIFARQLATFSSAESGNTHRAAPVHNGSGDITLKPKQEAISICRGD